MKILRTLLYLFVILIVLYVVLCFTGSKAFDVKRSITIKASPAAIFEEIADFNHWKKWNPWYKIDTTTKVTVQGEPMTVGHKYDWSGEKMGNGEMTISEITPNKEVKMKLLFKDWNSLNDDAFTLIEKGDSTELVWTMKGAETPFFLRGFMVIMGGQQAIEKDFDNGLKSIKEIAEAKPVTPEVSMEEMTIPDTWYVGKRMTKKMNEITAELFGNTYAEIGKIIGGMDKLAGAPFSIGHSVDYANAQMDLEIALPIAAQMNVPEGYNCVMIPAGRAVKHVYYGPYEGTGKAWDAFMKAVVAKYEVRFPGYESYVNDPTTVTPDKIETWLIVPVK